MRSTLGERYLNSTREKPGYEHLAKKQKKELDLVFGSKYRLRTLGTLALRQLSLAFRARLCAKDEPPAEEAVTI